MPTPKTYYFVIFCQKLHENEIIWTSRGGVSLEPPSLDPPMMTIETEWSKTLPHSHYVHTLQYICGETRYASEILVASSTVSNK